MPRRFTFRLQMRTRRGGSWTTVEKVYEVNAAIRAGDILARTTSAFELQVVQGSEVVERWVLRDKPVSTENGTLAKGAR